MYHVWQQIPLLYLKHTAHFLLLLNKIFIHVFPKSDVGGFRARDTSPNEQPFHRSHFDIDFSLKNIEFDIKMHPTMAKLAPSETPFPRPPPAR